jgi:hypothetical protein
MHILVLKVQKNLMNQMTKYKYFKKLYWEKIVRKFKKKTKIACKVHNKQIKL